MGKRTIGGRSRVTKTRPQTGMRKSRSADRKRGALLPGRRISKKGKPYTETRRNRSDRRGSRL